MKYEINVNSDFSKNMVEDYIKTLILSFYMIKSGDYKMTEDSILVLNIEPENDMDRVLTEIYMGWILEEDGLTHTEEIQKSMENPRYIQYGIFDLIGSALPLLNIIRLDSFIKNQPVDSKRFIQEFINDIREKFICEDCGRTEKVFDYIPHIINKYLNMCNKLNDLNTTENLEEMREMIKDIGFDTANSYKYNIKTGKPRNFQPQTPELLTYVTGVYNHNGKYSLSDNYISSKIMDDKIKKDASKIITISKILAADLYLITDEEYELILKGIDRIVSIVGCEDRFDQQVLSEIHKYAKKTLEDEWNRKNK